MGERLLTIRNLQIEGFADDTWKPIVNGIDLDLDRGEVLGLIGESGAGKSTIGIAAMGYTRPGCRIVGGSIDFDGIQILEQTPEQIREVRGVRMSYVAQSAAASFNPAHKLIEQYAETPVQHGVLKFQQAAKNARAIYARLELPDPDKIGNRYPHQVSGGQLQRAMVAMAMSCEPDLIVFDEPTTALDVTTQIEVLAAIKDIVKQFNTAAIYITHDLAVICPTGRQESWYCVMAIWWRNPPREKYLQIRNNNTQEIFLRYALSRKILKTQRNRMFR